jgi:NADH-quinone oxidoreductase subunit N
LLALASLAGVPPLPGFWAKLAVLMATWKAFGPVPTALAALGGVVGVIYYLRPTPDLLAQTKEQGPPLSPGVLLALVLTAGAVLFLALAPGWGYWLASN